jgi:DNA-binding LytR/AlgR family response regulator
MDSLTFNYEITPEIHKAGTIRFMMSNTYERIKRILFNSLVAFTILTVLHQFLTYKLGESLLLNLIWLLTSTYAVLIFIGDYDIMITKEVENKIAKILKNSKKAHKLFSKTTVHLTEKTIQLNIDGKLKVVNMNKIYKIDEDENYIYIFPKKDNLIVIPTGIFTSNDKLILKEIIQKNR